MPFVVELELRQDFLELRRKDTNEDDIGGVWGRGGWRFAWVGCKGVSG